MNPLLKEAIKLAPFLATAARDLYRELKERQNGRRPPQSPEPSPDLESRITGLEQKLLQEAELTAKMADEVAKSLEAVASAARRATTALTVAVGALVLAAGTLVAVLLR